MNGIPEGKTPPARALRGRAAHIDRGMKRLLSFVLGTALACTPVLVLFAGCAGEAPRSAYALALSYDAGVLEGELTFSYYNETGGSRGELWFNLYGNAYREGAAAPPVSANFAAAAYYAGESFGGMEILSVSSCAEWDVCGTDENVLRVRLASPVPAGGRCEVAVRYMLTLANVRHRTGVTPHTVNLGNCYPVLCVWEGAGWRECVYAQNGDPFYSACADYRVTLSVPASYTAAFSGRVLSAAEESGRRLYTAELANARDFALVLSEEFSVLQCAAGDATVLYYYYSDPAPQQTAALARESLLYFSDTFGEYAYPTYSVVQAGFCYGGMEYPALVYVSDALEKEDAAYTLVHETAHQWWYAAVGSDQTLHAWQDEGLAEYSALLFFEQNGQYGFSREGLLRTAKGMYNAYYTVRMQVFGQADTAMDRALADFGAYEYVALTYAKGQLLFEALRTGLGERRFFAGLRRYYADYAGKLAAPENLAAGFRNKGAEGILSSFRSGEAVL